jgi:molecular chaperone GrpE
MVSFRREKKKREMKEKRMAEEAKAAHNADEQNEQGEPERARVNDRRRVIWDDETGDVRAASSNDSEGAAAQTAQANFKTPLVEELEAQLREAEQRVRAADQKVLDVQARFEQVRAELQRETDALRQRLNRQADERALREKMQFVNALLPVLDNLRRAFEAAEASGADENLLHGLRGMISGFENALRSIGVEPVEAHGAQFDPELHEAVDMIEAEPENNGVITKEYSRGYRLGNQLLRPARVQVGRS